jgi:hemoglobin
MNSQASELNEQHITQLVESFYGRARADALLGPVFESAVADWGEHHRIVEDFWSRTLLGTNRYRGHPYAVHTHLSLRPEHFERWLALFRETALEVLPPDAAERAIARVGHMAESFKAGLFTFGQHLPPVHGKPAV